MFDVKDKRPENDQSITIEDNIWIGAWVTILKGVTIGTGPVIAAGNIVTKSIPKSSIAAGAPAHVFRPQFSATEFERRIEIMNNDLS